MKLLLSLSGKSDAAHAKVLEKTGFWGLRGAGCVVMSATTGRILLPLRSDKVQEPNTWGTWGGAVDSGENLLAAALRELREESGYKKYPLRVEEVFRYVSGTFTYTTFLAVVDNEFKPELRDGETSRAEWFDLDHLPDNLHFGLRAVLDDGKAASVLKKSRGRYAARMVRTLPNFPSNR